jgi:hypothetical protein
MVCLKRRKYRLFLQIWRDFVLRQHRIIPALRLKHRSGGWHGICVAKMLDKTSSIICAFGLASVAPRSPYRHLELCGIALKDLEIHKGFLRLFALHPACVCEISVIFFVFRYTLEKL